MPRTACKLGGRAVLGSKAARAVAFVELARIGLSATVFWFALTVVTLLAAPRPAAAAPLSPRAGPQPADSSPVSLLSPPARNLAALNCSEAFFTQPVSHFSWAPPPGSAPWPPPTWQQRYFVCPGHAAGEAPPVLFYFGNEDNVELYVEHTGLMWESAPALGAALVFLEHRFYGRSLPFAPGTPGCMSYLTTEQALADAAVFLSWLRAGKQPQLGPVGAVVGFGGSYGGMMAAWFRAQYPHLVEGVISGSAPIWSAVHTHPASDADVDIDIVDIDIDERVSSPSPHVHGIGACVCVCVYRYTHQIGPTPHVHGVHSPRHRCPYTCPHTGGHVYMYIHISTHIYISINMYTYIYIYNIHNTYTSRYIHPCPHTGPSSTCARPTTLAPTSAS